MTVTVNGERVEVDDPTTIAALIERLGYPDRGIAVALDWTVVPRCDWDTALTDGARIDVVAAVQGG